MYMVDISQFYCPGGGRQTNALLTGPYVTEQGCRPKSIRGVTEGGGWVKMAIFSVLIESPHPAKKLFRGHHRVNVFLDLGH